VTFAGPQRAQAANECGVGPTVTCTEASYPGGIIYSTGPAAQTVTLDNRNMTSGRVQISGASNGDFILNAARFQSVTSGTIALSIVNTGATSGSGFITSDAGTVTSSFGGSAGGTVFAQTSLGTARVTLNGGLVVNTALSGGGGQDSVLVWDQLNCNDGRVCYIWQ
jgi:hypothetical protein